MNMFINTLEKCHPYDSILDINIRSLNVGDFALQGFLVSFFHKNDALRALMMAKIEYRSTFYIQRKQRHLKNSLI